MKLLYSYSSNLVFAGRVLTPISLLHPLCVFVGTIVFRLGYLVIYDTVLTTKMVL
jgi:hypothetical protein